MLNDFYQRFEHLRTVFECNETTEPPITMHASNELHSSDDLSTVLSTAMQHIAGLELTQQTEIGN